MQLKVPGNAERMFECSRCIEALTPVKELPHAQTSHEKIPGLPNRSFPMDAERINQIGASLTDLTARTHELRGYL